MYRLEHQTYVYRKKSNLQSFYCNVILLDEDFHLHTVIYPIHVQSMQAKPIIVYLPIPINFMSTTSSLVGVEVNRTNDAELKLQGGKPFFMPIYRLYMPYLHALPYGQFLIANKFILFIFSMSQRLFYYLYSDRYSIYIQQYAILLLPDQLFPLICTFFILCTQESTAIKQGARKRD